MADIQPLYHRILTIDDRSIAIDLALRYRASADQQGDRRFFGVGVGEILWLSMSTSRHPILPIVSVDYASSLSDYTETIVQEHRNLAEIA